MKAMRLLFLLALTLTLLLPLFAEAGTGDSLTVGEAVDLVLAHNPALDEASQAISAAKARVNLSRGGYLPSANVVANYTLLEPVASIQFGGGGLDLYPANNYDFHIGVVQPIYDFSRTGAQVDAAESRVTLAEDSRTQLQRDLAYRTVETFYSILVLRRSLDVQDEQVRTLSEHLATTQKKIASGTATQLEALTTQVRVAEAQTLKINLQNLLANAETTLRRLAGLPQDSVLPLRGDFAIQPITLNQDSLGARALRQRIEARTAQHALETARALERSARSSDNPSVDAFAQYGFRNGFMPNLDVLRGNIAAGVQLTIPILDASRSGSLTEEAQAQISGAEARARDVELQLRAEVRQAADELSAASEKLQVSEVNVERANLAVENARLRYEAGTVQNLDLLDATTDRAQAKLSNLRAMYEVVVSTYRMRRAIGDPPIQ